MREKDYACVVKKDGEQGVRKREKEKGSERSGGRARDVRVRVCEEGSKSEGVCGVEHVKVRV